MLFLHKDAGNPARPIIGVIPESESVLQSSNQGRRPSPEAGQRRR